MSVSSLIRLARERVDGNVERCRMAGMRVKPEIAEGAKQHLELVIRHYPDFAAALGRGENPHLPDAAIAETKRLDPEAFSAFLAYARAVKLAIIYLSRCGSVCWN